MKQIMSTTTNASDGETSGSFNSWRNRTEHSLLDEDSNLYAESFTQTYDQSYYHEHLSSYSKGEMTFLAEKFQSMGITSEFELSFENDVSKEPELLLISFEEVENGKCPLMPQPTCTKSEIENIDDFLPGANSTLMDRPFTFDAFYEPPISDFSSSSAFSTDSSGRGKLNPNVEQIKTLDVGKIIYTEEELQEILSKHQRTAEEKFLEKCRENKADQNAFLELTEISKLCRALREANEEIVIITMSLKEKVKCRQEDIHNIKIENEKLQEAISKESHSNEELGTSFHEILTRYQQSKNMIKSYQDNEESLVKEIKLLKNKLEEQEKTNAEYETKQQDIQKFNTAELASLKILEDKEISVLNAKLQKAELTITSLQSSINQLRVENTELSTIYDDLVGKA